MRVCEEDVKLHSIYSHRFARVIMLDFTVAIRAKSMLMIVPAALRLKPTKTECNLLSAHFIQTDGHALVPSLMLYR